MTEKSKPAMNLAIKFTAPEPRLTLCSDDDRIRAFLAGETDGEDLLHAIYDHVLDEPVPDRLRALLKR